jgi:alkanesulfonate monooxygenase
MPVKIIGMIGTQQEGVAVHLIKGKISREWVIDFTRLHEQWDYDSVLVGYYASAAEGFAIALYAADHTERIKFLIAHRPGSVAPALAARQVATFDQLTQGRMSLHIIAGTSDQDQASEGDFLPKNDRYRRAGEYLDVMRRIWTSDSPLNHHGEFYRVEGAYSDIKPFQQPYPRLFFGGSSEGALEMGARYCDVFAIFGEPLAETRDRLDDFRRRTAAFGRRADFNMSLRTIMADTEGAAWDKAQQLLADVERKAGAAPQPSNYSGERLLSLAARGDVHDQRLWMGIARATGAHGNTSCLVGTPEQVAASVLEYYRLGIHSFLLRGFENPDDTIAIGRELIPLIRAGAAELDRQAEAAE